MTSSFCTARLQQQLERCSGGTHLHSSATPAATPISTRKDLVQDNVDVRLAEGLHLHRAVCSSEARHGPLQHLQPPERNGGAERRRTRLHRAQSPATATTAVPVRTSYGKRLRRTSVRRPTRTRADSCNYAYAASDSRSAVSSSCSSCTHRRLSSKGGGFGCRPFVFRREWTSFSDEYAAPETQSLRVLRAARMTQSGATIIHALYGDIVSGRGNSCVLSDSSRSLH